MNDIAGRSNRAGGLTGEEIMRVFDALPPELRQALAVANHPWAPSWAARVIRAGLWPLEAIVERIHEADREEARRHALDLLRGRG